MRHWPRWLACTVPLVALASITLNDSRVDAQTARPPPDAPASARIHNGLSAIAQTSAIVEATLDRTAVEYAPGTGPWTRFEFSNVAVHRGDFSGETLSFVQQGGLLPDGRLMVLSHVPRFIAGERYLIFLRNTSWHLSPVVGEYAFRMAYEAGRQLLIGQNEGAVVGAGEKGIRLSEPLFARPNLNSATRPQRLHTQRTPGSVLSVDSVLQWVDALSSIRGVAVGGRFYAEPKTRSAEIPVARHRDSAAIVHSPEATREPGTPDVARPEVLQ